MRRTVRWWQLTSQCSLPCPSFLCCSGCKCMECCGCPLHGCSPFRVLMTTVFSQVVLRRRLEGISFHFYCIYLVVWCTARASKTISSHIWWLHPCWIMILCSSFATPWSSAYFTVCIQTILWLLGSSFLMPWMQKQPTWHTWILRQFELVFKRLSMYMDSIH